MASIKASIDGYKAFLSIAIIAGTIGNGLVIMVFIKNKAQTSTDWFIIFIAAMDLISSVVNVPVYLTFVTDAWAVYGSDEICKAHMFLSQSVALSSTFLICGMALERYFKVCKPTALHLSKTKARNICMAITFVNLFCSIPCVVLYKLTPTGVCLAIGVSKYWVDVYYTCVLATFLVAFVIVVFSYLNVALVVHRSAKNLLQHKQRPSQSTAPPAIAFPGLRSSKVSPLAPQPGAAVDPKVSATNGDPPTNPILVTESSGACFASSSSSSGCGHGPKSNQLLVNDSHASPNTRQVNVQTLHVSGNAVSQPSPSTFSSARGSTSGGTSDRRHMKTTKIAFLVCTIFIVSWLPPWLGFALYTTRALPITPGTMVFYMFSRMTYLVNTFMNPILYVALNAMFRRKVVSLFKGIVA